MVGGSAQKYFLDIDATLSGVCVLAAGGSLRDMHRRPFLFPNQIFKKLSSLKLGFLTYALKYTIFV
jgi:hypothetical protein